MKIDKKLKVFEGFAGYGSQLLELKELGIHHESVGTSEIDYNAILAYAAVHNTWWEIKEETIYKMRNYLIERNIGFNFKTGKSAIIRMKEETLRKIYSAVKGQKCYGDISLINPDNLPAMDLFTYSFPCQDISRAGNERGFNEQSGTRSSLLWECRKIVKGVKPNFLMMENVKDLINKKHKPNFEKWIEWLDGQGYNNYYKIINAKNSGVPQSRERVFLVSILKEIDDGTFKFIENFDNGVRLIDILEEEVDEKYFIDIQKSEEVIRKHIEKLENQQTKEDTNKLDMIGLLNMKGNESIRRVYNPEGLCPTITTMQGGHREPKIIIERPFLIETENGIEVREATKKGYKLAKHGDSVNLEQPNSLTRRGRVGYGVAQTLTTSCNQGVVVKYNNKTYVSFRVRKLTPKECLRLMGLTDTEIKNIKTLELSNSQEYKLAGNSIVKQTMAFLGRLPLEKLQSGIADEHKEKVC